MVLCLQYCIGGENNNVLHEEIGVKRNFLSNQQRHAVYDALLERSVDGKLKKDTTKIVAELFSLNIRTIQRIWKRGKNCVDGEIIDVSHMKARNCGRKRIEIDINCIREIPLNQ